MLDSGDGVTHAVPVFEGFSMPHAIRRIDVAGRDVTDHLQLLLRKSGYHLHTTAEKEVVRMISKFSLSRGIVWCEHGTDLVSSRDFAEEKTCYVALSPAKEEKDGGGRGEDFRLPDGNIIRVSVVGFLPPRLPG